ncbi:enoyl-CoA hydratase [compost metagenome]
MCREAYGNTLEEQLEQEALRMVRAQATEESREGMAAFLEKRTPDFTQLRQSRV